MIDLYADENKPVCKKTHDVYRITLPHEIRMSVPTRDIPWIYVLVDEYGMISIDDASTRWPLKDSVLVDKREIYEYLIEWELAEWRAIGQEDHELFATKLLTKGESNV